MCMCGRYSPERVATKSFPLWKGVLLHPPNLLPLLLGHGWHCDLPYQWNVAEVMPFLVLSFKKPGSFCFLPDEVSHLAVKKLGLDYSMTRHHEKRERPHERPLGHKTQESGNIGPPSQAQQAPKCICLKHSPHKTSRWTFQLSPSKSTAHPCICGKLLCR